MCVFYCDLDVLDMVDVILEGSEGDVQEIGPSLTDEIILQTFPFSAIVPAVLEVRNKLPETFKDGKGNIQTHKIKMSTVLK